MKINVGIILMGEKVEAELQDKPVWVVHSRLKKCQNPN